MLGVDREGQEGRCRLGVWDDHQPLRRRPTGTSWSRRAARALPTAACGTPSSSSACSGQRLQRWSKTWRQHSGRPQPQRCDRDGSRLLPMHVVAL